MTTTGLARNPHRPQTPAACVVGIDPSLAASGVAVIRRSALGDVSPRPELRTFGRSGKRDEPWEMRARRITIQSRDVLEFVRNLQPTLVVMEGPAYGIDLPSAFDRAGVWWGVFAGLNSRRIPIAVCAPATRALWATGKGNADKATVLAAVRGLWPNTAISDHNQGDALVLAHAGAQHLGWLAPEELQHEPALSKITWPRTGA